MIIGIDASRNRSGGAIAYLIGILSNLQPENYNIEKIHLWSYKTLLDKIPNSQWLVKHNPIQLEKKLYYQIFWQIFILNQDAKKHKCDLLFATDASTFSFFNPLIVLSQDMLSYEPGVMKFFGYTVSRLRLVAILFIQNWAFRRSKGVIFLTKYAAETIQKSCGNLKSIVYIPHGIDPKFNMKLNYLKLNHENEKPFNCVYVSNAEMYKHHDSVIKAIGELRNNGYNVTLTLIGGGKGLAQNILRKSMKEVDPNSNFIVQHDFISHDKIPVLISEADIGVFASSCENMPITLLEYMSVGLPIACSERGPMPEVLEDAGVYFNPENTKSIYLAIEKIILNKNLRVQLSKRSKQLAKKYTWKRCSTETFSYITNLYNKKLNEI